MHVWTRKYERYSSITQQTVCPFFLQAYRLNSILVCILIFNAFTVVWSNIMFIPAEFGYKIVFKTRRSITSLLVSEQVCWVVNCIEIHNRKFVSCWNHLAMRGKCSKKMCTWIGSRSGQRKTIIVIVWNIVFYI